MPVAGALKLSAALTGVLALVACAPSDPVTPIIGAGPDEKGSLRVLLPSCSTSNVATVQLILQPSGAQTDAPFKDAKVIYRADGNAAVPADGVLELSNNPDLPKRSGDSTLPKSGFLTIKVTMVNKLSAENSFLASSLSMQETGYSGGLRLGDKSVTRAQLDAESCD